jgi:hypothetical protein
MPDPRVSVITTVYNGERFLDQAIESILKQDFADLEYIIIDDGSTDNTPEILQSWARRDLRIRIERLSENVGIARAFNRALDLARGQYTCRHDADDICVGPRLRRQVEQLDRDPDTVLVTANCVDIDANGFGVREHVVENPPEVIAYLLIFGNPIMGAGGQGMYRTATAREMGGFREDFQASLDYEFFCRLSARGQMVVLPFTGLMRRLHDGQISARWRPAQLRNSLSSSRKMLTAYLGRTLSDAELVATASVCQQTGQTGVAVLANHVFREAYARFSEGGKANRMHCDVVRRVTANWWVHAAVPLIKKGAFAEAGRHVAYAMSWHPSAVTTCVAILARRVFGGTPSGSANL